MPPLITGRASEPLVAWHHQLRGNAIWTWRHYRIDSAVKRRAVWQSAWMALTFMAGLSAALTAIGARVPIQYTGLLVQGAGACASVVEPAE